MVNCIMHLPIGTCFIDVVNNRMVHVSLHVDRVLKNDGANVMKVFQEIAERDSERVTVYEQGSRIHFHFLWFTHAHEEPGSSVQALVEVVSYLESLDVCIGCVSRVAKQVHGRVCDHCREVAATKIQRRFKEAMSNPAFMMCRQRLMREWDELTA